MDFIFGQLHPLMLETELEAVPADSVSFGHCILSFRRVKLSCKAYVILVYNKRIFEVIWNIAGS